MILRQVKIQLVVFALITVATLWYGAVSLFDVGRVVHPPYTVSAQFADADGLYPRADVDLLGTRVGAVKELRPGPGSGTTVVMEIDPDVEISTDVHATVGSKSAIGEGYVQLVPMSTGGETLTDGDVITTVDTTSPPDLALLLGHLDALARSVPLDKLATVLREGSTAVDGLGPSFGRLINDSHTVASRSLADVESLTALIHDARTVLGTQVALGSQTRVYLHELAGLTGRLRELDRSFAGVYSNGISAGTQVTDLLRDTQSALPVLLTNLISLTTVASDRIPQLRKTLVVFPWVLENGSNTARYCDEYDIRTGKPVQRTCHLDDNGQGIYTLHLAQQLDQGPGGAASYNPCTKGYGDTLRYQPDGTPVGGAGARERVDSEPNLRATCAAPPTDADTPNVRGSQNVTTPAFRRQSGMAIYNPRSGMLVTPDAGAYRLSGMHGPPPPDGSEGLGWLLVQALR